MDHRYGFNLDSLPRGQSLHLPGIGGVDQTLDQMVDMREHLLDRVMSWPMQGQGGQAAHSWGQLDLHTAGGRQVAGIVWMLTAKLSGDCFEIVDDLVGGQIPTQMVGNMSGQCPIAATEMQG